MLTNKHAMYNGVECYPSKPEITFAERHSMLWAMVT
jgi:hypothetical protein